MQDLLTQRLALFLSSALLASQLFASEIAVSATEDGVDLENLVPAQALVNALMPIVGDESPLVERTLDLDIRFESGSARLSQESLRQIEELAEGLAAPELGEAQLKIIGHTDAVGSAADNQRLSEQRAAAVLLAISALVKIEPGRIETAGVGETELKDSENPNSGVNRRVEISASYFAEVTPEHEREEKKREPSRLEVDESVLSDDSIITE